jgi:triphosphatase
LPAAPKKLHAVRIAVKKLRYGVEFFGSLYDPCEVERLRSVLAKLQDALGAINDAAAAVDRVRVVCRRDGRWPAWTTDWAASLHKSQRAELSKRWQRLQRERAFW